jgi:hypothetical protein
VTDLQAGRADALLDELARNAGRAMTRLNKIKVGSNVRQQQLLTEAQDYVAEILDAVQAEQDRRDDDASDDKLDNEGEDRG